MRKRTVGVVLLAALAFHGGSASTASSSFTRSANAAGYGQSAVSGTRIIGISYRTLATDSSKLAKVVFTATTDITGHTVTAMLKDDSGSPSSASSPYACSLGTWDAVTSSMPVTCATTDHPLLSAVGQTGITVTR